MANRLADKKGGGNGHAVGENDGKREAQRCVSVDLRVDQKVPRNGSVPKPKLRLFHVS